MTYSIIDKITIQKIKDSASVVDVLSDFIDLTRDGERFTCLCPFHEDRHIGSFKISPRKNMYKCFSCGAYGKATDFLMEREGYTFKEAIQYLGKKYSIDVEGAEKFNPKPAKPYVAPPPAPMLELDFDKYMKPTLYQANNLTRWMDSLPFNNEQRKRIPTTLKNYALGTSKEGHAIFWQMDENGKVRTGKMMHYKTDGHRDTERNHNFDWIHSMLFRYNIIDFNEYEMVQTLYGMHLLKFAKPLTVNIVESEKTALLCTIIYGGIQNQLWMATGGKENLKREKLQPIIDKNIPIVLYPDKDATSEWKRIAKDIGYKNLIVNESFMKTYWTPEDGGKADIADVLLRIMNENKENDNAILLKDLMATHPAMQILMNKLNLEIDNGEQ